MMDVKPVTELKANMPQVLKDLQESHNPILVVSKGKPQAVLQDVESYQHTQDAIAMMKMMLQSEQSVLADQGSSTSSVMKRLRQQVRSRA